MALVMWEGQPGCRILACVLSPAPSSHPFLTPVWMQLSTCTCESRYGYKAQRSVWQPRNTNRANKVTFLCGAVTSCENVIGASACCSSAIQQQGNVPLRKMLESKQGPRAGQLFQLSAILDENQQQLSGNTHESGNCLISYDSRCQISRPVKFCKGKA